MSKKGRSEFPQHINAHPVDKGWAWIIMLSSFVVQFLSLGYQRSFGILFVEFQAKFGSTSAMTSAINGCQSFAYCILTLLTMNFLINKTTIRTSCIIGALLQATGVASSCLVSNSELLILTQGILFGCGHALLYCPTLLIVSQYFERHRSLATTLASCGASAGGVAFPLLTRLLLGEYGLQGTLLLLSGVLLQQLVFVLCYTPPSDYQCVDKDQEKYPLAGSLTAGVPAKDTSDWTEMPVKTELLEFKETLKLVDSAKSADDLSQKTKTANTQYHSLDELLHVSVTGAKEKPRSQVYPLIHQQYLSRSSEVTKALSKGSTDLIHSSMPSLIMKQLLSKNKLDEDDRQTSFALPLTESCKTENEDDGELEMEVPSLWTPPVVLRMPEFWGLAVFFVCGALGTGLPPIFFPALAVEHGLTKEDGAFFLMVSSLVDTFGRIIPGFILHFKIIGPSTLMLFPLVVCGAMYTLTSLFTSFYSLLAFILVYGLLTSSFWALQTLIVIDMLGLNLLASSLGFYAVFMGFSSGIAFPFAGWLRDVSGTYTSTFYFFGGTYFIAALALVLLLFGKKCLYSCTNTL